MKCGIGRTGNFFAFENSKVKPDIVGIAKGGRETGVSLVGGETAEMPDTYLPDEHDLVGVITGVVEKDKRLKEIGTKTYLGKMS